MPTLAGPQQLNKLRYVESSEPNLKDESLKHQTDLHSMNELRTSTYSSHVAPQVHKPSRSASMLEPKLLPGKTRLQGGSVVQNGDPSGDARQSKRDQKQAEKSPRSKSSSSSKKLEERKRSLKLDMNNLKVPTPEASPWAPKILSR